jgi:hypothetical protein
VLEILVQHFVRFPQGVKNDSLSILRIDYKYNPMAHDAKLHIETICISNLEI